MGKFPEHRGYINPDRWQTSFHFQDMPPKKEQVEKYESQRKRDDQGRPITIKIDGKWKLSEILQKQLEKPLPPKKNP